MLLFKTSAATLDSVIENKKHALHHEPKSWYKNEVLLISKRRKDCARGEKQIQYIMILDSIQKLDHSEIKPYWPNADNNWNYLVTCSKVIPVPKPFDLVDVIGENKKDYGPSLKPKKISKLDEEKIANYLKRTGTVID